MKIWIKRGLILSLIVYLLFIVLLNLAGSQIVKSIQKEPITGGLSGLETLSAIFPIFPYFSFGTFIYCLIVGFILSSLTSYTKYLIENFNDWSNLTIQGKSFTIILTILNFVFVYFLFWYILRVIIFGISARSFN